MEFELDWARVEETPMETALLIQKNENESKERLRDKMIYQALVRSLLYANGYTRPNISISVN